MQSLRTRENITVLPVYIFRFFFFFFNWNLNILKHTVHGFDSSFYISFSPTFHLFAIYIFHAGTVIYFCVEKIEEKVKN